MKREILELREVVRKLVPLLTGKGLEVTQRGSQAYVRTDPVTRRPIVVNIPNVSENASDSFVRAISGFIDHEVAHVLITDWNYYGGAPTADDLKKPEVQKLMNCHNIVEDTMIEREIVKIFPGSGKNIANLREHFIRKVTIPAMAKATTDKERFDYLIVPLMRALAGHVEFQEYMDNNDYWSLPMVKKLVEAFDEQTIKDLKTVDTTQQTLVIAKELYDILYNKPPETPPAPEPQKGPSQDKPEKQAGEGDGDGERDHSDAEDNEDENDSDEPSGDTSSEGPDETDDEASDDDADEASDADDEADDAGDDDAEKDDDDSSGSDADVDDGDESEDGDGENDATSGEDDSEAEDGEDGGSSNSGDDTDESDDGGEGDSGDGGEGSDSDDGDSGDDDEGDDTPGGSKPGKGADSLKSDGGRDESESHAPKDSDEESDGGSGVGSEEAKSVFEFDEDALEGRGLSEEMTVLISEEAVESIRHSDWSVFSREWDKVEPLEVPEKINSKWVPSMEEEVSAMTGRMQKDIERIMASQSHVVNTPGHKRGRLHSASLYRVSQGDPRVFTQKQEHQSKDTAVMLLVDNSGSMSGQKMRAAMTSSYALSSTLDRVGIAHEMIGFTTGGWSGSEEMYEATREEYDKSGLSYDRVIPIVMPIYKTFEERLDATVKKRVAYSMNAQRGLNGNIDGESLMIAAERLAVRPEKRKVMLVLSDGQPAGGRNSGPHLKGTVEHLNKNGIETIGIGIMSRAVETYYDNSVVLYSVDDLPGQVMSEIKRLLA